MLLDEDKTAAAVAEIRADTLEWNDINGQLPPVPDQIENNKTLTGVDSNSNGIRDDVERFIYLENKENPSLTIAMLQYAKNVELYLTKVYNQETWKAVAEEGDRAYRCVFEKLEDQNDGNTIVSFELTTEKTQQVSDWVFNTSERIRAKEKAYDFTTSYGYPGEKSCDLSIENGEDQ